MRLSLVEVSAWNYVFLICIFGPRSINGDLLHIKKQQVIPAEEALPLAVPSQAHRRAADPVPSQCPAPTPAPPGNCDSIPNAIAEYEDSIKEMGKAYLELDCDDDPDEDNVKTCESLVATKCDFEANKEKFIQDLNAACKAADVAAIVLSDLKDLMAKDPLTNEEVCDTTALEIQTQAVNSIQGLSAALILMEQIIGSIEAGQEIFAAIPLFGSAGSAIIAAVLIILYGVQAILNVLKEDMEFVAEKRDYTDDACLEKIIRSTQEISYESFSMTEDYLRFLSMPTVQPNRVLGSGQRAPMVARYGAGCDGVDNDGDSIILGSFEFGDTTPRSSIPFYRVDECDEDLVPPTITLRSTPPAYFLSSNHAETWFTQNTIFSDDCAVELESTVTVDTTSSTVTVTVSDTRCRNQSSVTATVNGVSNVIVNGPGAYMTTVSFPFLVDACPLLPFSGQAGNQNRDGRPLKGQGCDGLDNDCDSSFIDAAGNAISPVRRVDECDEDNVPPTIILSKDPPKSFITVEQAHQWFRDHAVGSDDCATSDRLAISEKESDASSITLEVVDTICRQIDENGVSATVNGRPGVMVDGRGAFRSTKRFEFLINSCPLLPFSGNTQNHPSITNGPRIGEGCDGLDNDCDSNFLDATGVFEVLPTTRIDECDEDNVPPTLTLTKEPPFSFLTEGDAVQFFLENTHEEDDCSKRLTKRALNANTNSCGEGSVDIEVCTPCSSLLIAPPVTALVNGVTNKIVDGPGQPCVTETFEFKVDGQAPTVRCGFHKHQDINHVDPIVAAAMVPPFTPDGTMTPPEPADGEPLHIDYYYEESNLVNVEFWYEIEEIGDSCPDEEVNVKVTVASNEYERGDRAMLHSVEEQNLRSVGTAGPNPVNRVTLFLAPHTCQEQKGKYSKSQKIPKSQHKSDICLIEKNVDNRNNGNDFDFTTRFYDIIVSATDSSGNENSATCTVIVVPPHHYNSATSNPSKGSSFQLPPLPLDSTGKGKGKISPPHTPTTDLRAEYAQSTKRFVLDTFDLVWDTALETDLSIATPAPTGAPTGKGKGSGESQRGKRNGARGDDSIEVIDIKVENSPDTKAEMSVTEEGESRLV